MAPLKVTQNDLIDYRNKILHQQIHPDNKTYKAVREALITYCAKNGAIP